MIKCLIVDDEQHSIDVLLHHVKRTDFLELVGTTQDATKAISLINEHNVELLFQDIHMPELSGLDVVKILQGKCEVILTTAYPNYAVEGFELGVTDYLLKPISYPRFMKAVQKAVERMKAAELQSAQSSESDDDFIYVKTGLKNYVVKVVLDTIEYIECVKNYAAIMHDGKKTLVYTSLKDIESKLPPGRFIRVHRSYIVSTAAIDKVESNAIFLRNSDMVIPLSETFKAAFWQILNNKTVG